MSVTTNIMSFGLNIKGDSIPSDVLSGKTFMSEESEEIQTGTMSNNGAFTETVTPSEEVQEIVIPQGYHNGNGKIIVNPSCPSYQIWTAQNNGTHTLTLTGCSKYSKITVYGGQKAEAQANGLSMSATGVSDASNTQYSYVFQTYTAKITNDTVVITEHHNRSSVNVDAIYTIILE